MNSAASSHTLADEIEPFERRRSALHRRQRRRRVVCRAWPARNCRRLVVIAVIVIISVRRRARCTSPGSRARKWRRPYLAHRRDRRTRDSRSEGCTRRVRIGRQIRLIRRATVRPVRYSYRRTADSVRCRRCDGYTVDAATPGRNPNRVQHELTGRGTVYDTSDHFGIDFEVFFQVGIAGEYPLAVRLNLQSDADVASVNMLPRPTPMRSSRRTSPTSPHSCRARNRRTCRNPCANLRPNRSVAAVVRRYQHADGVDTVITSATPRLFDPASARPAHGKLVSPCARPSNSLARRRVSRIFGRAAPMRAGGTRGGTTGGATTFFDHASSRGRARGPSVSVSATP